MSPSALLRLVLPGIPDQPCWRRASFAIVALVGLAGALAEPALGQTATPQTATPKAQAAKKPALPAKGETPATVLDDSDVGSILGMRVRDEAGDNMGRIVDLLVDRDGKARAAIIDFGGFLGVGSRKVAVDWHALHFPTKGKLDEAILALSRDQVRTAPEYKPGEPVVVLQASSAHPPPAHAGTPAKATAAGTAPGKPTSAPAK
ncbi:hypothetical protein MHY1_00542 [Methylovirgula sp. HY1]|nr:hypothetical protein MHY1_00542 [Methylovirgula sp. HY1]